MVTISKEDYLKAIYEAECEGERVISATLAHWLKVSAPAVTMALRRLKRDGLVTIQAKRRIALTAAGKRIAQRTVNRHHLIERMLHEVFGMEWYKVHEEAERLEHAVSDDFEAKLAEKLGRDASCPHGNGRQPESASARRKRGLLLLSEAQANKIYRVQSIYEREQDLLEFLEKQGIRPNGDVTVLKKNYDDTFTLKGARGRVTVGKPV